MENRDGATTCGRRALEGDRAAVAGTESAATDVSGTQTNRRPTALTGIVFVLKTGIAWEDLPQELGCGSGMSCWRRMRAWLAAGVWDRLQTRLIERLDLSGENRLVSRRCGFQQRARCFWGTPTGPNPVDRAKPGSKHHVLTDAGGIPLVTAVSAANHHDSRYLFPLLIGLPDHLRAKIASLYADRAYDCAAFRERLLAEGITPFLAKRGTAHGSGLGRHRWVVERTISWLHQFRRLRLRYERHGYLHRAFLSLAASLLAVRHLAPSFC
jgi:transposase